jgi:hypothetical protein
MRTSLPIVSGFASESRSPDIVAEHGHRLGADAAVLGNETAPEQRPRR